MHVGQPVTFEVDAYPGYEFEGTGAEPERSDGRAVRAVAAGQRDGQLHEGGAAPAGAHRRHEGVRTGTSAASGHVRRCPRGYQEQMSTASASSGELPSRERRARADARVHGERIAARAHALGGGGDARVRGALRRGSGALGTHGAASRLRLRALSEQRALGHRGASGGGRAACFARAAIPRTCSRRFSATRRTAASRARRKMAKALFAVDELTGLITASALVRPSQERARSRRAFGAQEDEGQGVRARREPRGRDPGRVPSWASIWTSTFSSSSRPCAPWRTRWA